MPVALLLALGSGLCWGTADFFGGLQSRKLPALTVVFWSQLSGGLAVWLGLVLAGVAFEPGVVLGGMLAGLVGGLCLVLFYRALAIGAMSIVAPVSACGAGLPVAVSLARGEVPGALALGGVAAAMAGIILVSLPASGTPHPSGRPGLVLALSLGSALGFGSFFVLIDRAVESAAVPLWAVAGTRAASLPVILGLCLLAGRRPGLPGRRILSIGPIGLADVAANGLFSLASQSGNLGLVSVLGSMYPVATVLLAFVVLRERLARVHWAGVGLALTGVALMASG
jgi:drug/metabolite transporter (DMT)-like permease